jgi:NAD(P)-dependent dehydrogenase (short-subunit alcohol dehydrogenase family)
MGEPGRYDQVIIVNQTPGVIVTGGSKGIGFETCRHFAGQGYRVSLCGRDLTQVDASVELLRSEFSSSVFGLSADISDDGQVREFAQKSEEFHGPISNLICNAAVLGPVGRIENIDLRYFSRTYAVNVFSTVALIQSFWNQLNYGNNGRIVCISGGGLGGASPLLRTPAYVSSKAAVVELIETLHVELSELGMTINAVAPGSIPTNFMNEALTAGPDIAGEVLFKDAQSRDGTIPPNALNNYFELLDFLLSKESSLVTGRLLSARWDPPQKVLEKFRSDDSSNIYRLRRIDDDLFSES